MDEAIITAQFEQYIASNTCHPHFFCGDALFVLQEIPDQSMDFCMTSPPYWKKREYTHGGIGLEDSYTEYIDHLLRIFDQIKRVLKDTGSLWLNMGDTYHDKTLLALPWRVVIALTDRQGWILRNDVVWNKIKGTGAAKDRLRNTHEYLFHFVKQQRGYYYDIDAIRSKPRTARVKNGAVVSATGVTGVRYKRQIELSTALTPQEKANALNALNMTLTQIECGEIADFRMVLRNQQRTTHSDSTKVSGRAKELQQKGFYILHYHPNGSTPGDVWDIIPEDTHKRGNHYAAYPEDLCKIPILATCPPDGIILDPFCGTGTTNLVAQQLFRKSIGIDVSPQYIKIAQARCGQYLL